MHTRYRGAGEVTAAGRAHAQNDIPADRPVAGTAGTVVAPGPGPERRFLPALRLRPPAARPQTDQLEPVPGGGRPGTVRGGVRVRCLHGPADGWPTGGGTMRGSPGHPAAGESGSGHAGGLGGSPGRAGSAVPCRGSGASRRSRAGSPGSTPRPPLHREARAVPETLRREETEVAGNRIRNREARSGGSPRAWETAVVCGEAGWSRPPPKSRSDFGGPPGPPVPRPFPGRAPSRGR
jgi:hypothetical protein